jgi:hypothetical protein
MDPQIQQASGSAIWELARKQHWVVTRADLLDLGLGPDAIKHRISTGRLHPLWRGVYAVGRPKVSRLGMWMAAVLSCGSEAVLSHSSAAALWGICKERQGVIEVSVPFQVTRLAGHRCPSPASSYAGRRDSAACHPGDHARVHPR